MKKVVLLIVIFLGLSAVIFAQAGAITADASNAYKFLIDNMGQQVSSSYNYWYDQDGVKYYGSIGFDQYKDGNLDKSTMILLIQQNTVRAIMAQFQSTSWVNVSNWAIAFGVVLDINGWTKVNDTRYIKGDLQIVVSFETVGAGGYWIYAIRKG